MTDRELLELAAKAAKYKLWLYEPYDHLCMIGSHEEWNPLTDDGDALRLAVKLGIELEFFANCVRASLSTDGKYWEGNESLWVDKPDPYAATRRAIVRAAAHIGEGMT